MINKKEEYNFNIILVGDSRVGKTTLITRYIENYFNSYYYKTYCK